MVGIYFCLLIALLYVSIHQVHNEWTSTCSWLVNNFVCTVVEVATQLQQYAKVTTKAIVEMLCTLAAYCLLFAFVSSRYIKHGMYIQRNETTGQNSTHEHNALTCQVWVCAHRSNDNCNWTTVLTTDMHAHTVSQQKRCQVTPNCEFFTFNLKTRECFLSPSHSSWTAAANYKAGPRVCGEKNYSKLCQTDRFVMIRKLEVMHCASQHITAMCVAHKPL